MSDGVLQRNRKARIRSYDAAIKRTTRAASELSNAMLGDLEGDAMGRGVAEGQLIEAERDCEGALALIRDCRRSLATVTEADVHD